MAARRSRLQIKPNIGIKAASGPRRSQLNDDKTTAVPITPELAFGAATAVNLNKGPDPANQSSGPLANNAAKVSSQKDVKSVSFTRLKRFGLNLGSQSQSRIDINSDSINTSASPQKSVSSPVYKLQKGVSNPPLSPQKSVSSPPLSPQKSVNISSYSPQKSVRSTAQSPQKSHVHIINDETLGNDDVQSSNKLPVALARKVGTIVPKVPARRNVSSLDSKVHQTPESGSSSQSLQKSNTMETDQSHSTDNSKLELENTTVKPPPVIQRLPFRTRLPKPKPNIDALRLKNKNLHGGKEDSSSRPSSPLKSPKIGRFFSPVKAFQPVHKAVSPDIDVQSEKSIEDEDSQDTEKEKTPEARKRHFSNSSISTVNSDVQGSSKNVKQKSPKGDNQPDVPLDRSCMKMGDLVYYNPLKNPMNPVTPKKKAKLEKEKENVCVQETTEDIQEEKSDNKEGEDMPVPQVKIGPDGSIILNEDSIVIKKQDDNVVTEVIEENGNTATYASFRKPLNRIGWSEWETEKFYRALSYLGTDFSLMIKLFPNRTRCDIKTKFKKEDKYNKNKVDFALKNKKPFSMSFFKEEEELDKLETERKKRESEEKLKKSKQIKAEKLKEKKKLKEMEDLPATREKYRLCRDKRKKYFEDDENDGDTSEIESVTGTPIKTPIRLSFKRRDSLPFVPPFCLSQDEDSDAMETQVNMSDSEILTPQKQTRPELTQMADNFLPGTTFPPNANIQVTQMTDANNSPLVLVYQSPEDGKGETVIHVYQLQNHQLGNASHIQIPLNDGAGVLQLPNMQTSVGNNVMMSEEEEQSESTPSQDNLPFIIASGDGNPEQLLVQPGTDEKVTENDDFIDVIDINASKIKTPKKQSSEKDQNIESSCISMRDYSLYQAENLQSDNVVESDDSRTSSPPLVIDNEFVATDLDTKNMYISPILENEKQPIKKQGRRKR